MLGSLMMLVFLFSNWRPRLFLLRRELAEKRLREFFFYLFINILWNISKKNIRLKTISFKPTTGFRRVFILFRVCGGVVDDVVEGGNSIEANVTVEDFED